MSQSDRDFNKEIEKIRKMIGSQEPSLDGDLVVETDPDGRIQADFDLPYSSFPQVAVHGRWAKTQMP